MCQTKPSLDFNVHVQCTHKKSVRSKFVTFINLFEAEVDMSSSDMNEHVYMTPYMGSNSSLAHREL